MFSSPVRASIVESMPQVAGCHSGKAAQKKLVNMNYNISFMVATRWPNIVMGDKSKKYQSCLLEFNGQTLAYVSVLKIYYIATATIQSKIPAIVAVSAGQGRSAAVKFSPLRLTLLSPNSNFSNRLGSFEEPWSSGARDMCSFGRMIETIASTHKVQSSTVRFLQHTANTLVVG